MTTVNIQEEYASILESLDASVNEALQQYALEKVQARLVELVQRIQKWEQKYGGSYDLFHYRTSPDEAYVHKLDANPDTQQWEGDLLTWEFDMTELRTWQQHLQTLLSKS